MLTDADELFTEMAERGVFPDLYTLTTLIRCRCKNGNMNKALSFFGAMTKEYQTRYYNTLIDGFCKMGEIEKAYDLWDGVNSRKIFPNHITYGILMNTYCCVGHVPVAFRL